MSEAAILAIVSGPAWLTLGAVVSWLRNRRKEDAEAGLTVDQRWENYADAMDKRVKGLEDRIAGLEGKLKDEQQRRVGLEAEVVRYKRIARSLARHVLRLRDVLAQVNVEIPTLPADVEEAMTVIELP